MDLIWRRGRPNPCLFWWCSCPRMWRDIPATEIPKVLRCCCWACLAGRLPWKGKLQNLLSLRLNGAKIIINNIYTSFKCDTPLTKKVRSQKHRHSDKRTDERTHISHLALGSPVREGDSQGPGSGYLIWYIRITSLFTCVLVVHP